ALEDGPELVLAGERELVFPHLQPHLSGHSVTVEAVRDHSSRAVPSADDLEIAIVVTGSVLVSLPDAELTDLPPGWAHLRSDSVGEQFGGGCGACRLFPEEQREEFGLGLDEAEAQHV